MRKKTQQVRVPLHPIQTEFAESLGSLRCKKKASTTATPTNQLHQNLFWVSCGSLRFQRALLLCEQQTAATLLLQKLMKPNPLPPRPYPNSPPLLLPPPPPPPPLPLQQKKNKNTLTLTHPTTTTTTTAAATTVWSDQTFALALK